MSNTVPNKPNSVPSTNTNKTRRPNEAGAFHVQAHVKIFDPATKTVYVEKRA